MSGTSLRELVTALPDPAAVTRLETTVDGLTAFGAEATDRIDRMSPPGLVPGLVGLGQEFRAWRERIASSAADLDELRGRVSATIADLHARRVALQAETTDRERWTEQRTDAADGGLLGDALDVVLPFVGDTLVREAKSELAYGRSSEQAVAEADVHLADIAEVDARIAETQQAIDTATACVGAVQDLDNTLSLLAADLTDAEHVTAHVTTQTWPLFQVTLRTGLRSLLDTLAPTT